MAPPSDASSSLAESAKEVFLRAARISGWASAWCGAGEAAGRAGQLGEMEAALCEANVRDNRVGWRVGATPLLWDEPAASANTLVLLLAHQNAEVWGWLCLLCLQSSPVREAEAAQALDQALKQGLAHGALLAEVGEVYLKLGKSKVAEGVLRRALVAAEDVHTRRLLADAFMAQGDAANALKEYTAVAGAGNASAGDREAAEAGAKQAAAAAGR